MSGNLKGTYNLGDPGVDGWILLKWMLKMLEGVDSFRVAQDRD
jgi:hypothetical protein